MSKVLLARAYFVYPVDLRSSGAALLIDELISGDVSWINEIFTRYWFETVIHRLNPVLDNAISAFTSSSAVHRRSSSTPHAFFSNDIYTHLFGHDGWWN